MTPSPFTARHRAVIRAIDGGASTLSAISAQTGYERLEVYESIKFLRKHGTVRRFGVPAIGSSTGGYVYWLTSRPLPEGFNA